MFTDLVGYTATIRKDEEAGRRVRLRHRTAVEAALSAHGGRLLQYFGDGSLSIFPSAVEAVAAAQEIQGQFSSGPEGSLRIGIDLGDIAYDEQGAYGDAVNVASRLESLSEPGGVLLSGKVNQELANHPEFETLPLGEVPLRNVDGPTTIFALSGEGLRTPVSLSGTTGPQPGVGPSLEPRSLAEMAEALWGQSSSSVARRRPPQSEEGILPDRLPLVGREGEMNRLRGHADRVEAGTGQTVLLTGDRGVGKSRIADQLAEELVDRGWLVARGQAYSSERGVPFAPFSEALGPILTEMSPSELQLAAQGGAHDLAVLWPPIGGEKKDGRRADSSPGEARSRLLWTLSQFLSTLTGVRPLLFILEDLQWADDSSLDLLHFIARQLGDKRVLLVPLFCESETDPHSHLREVCESLDRGRMAHRVRLGPLSGAATEDLVTTFFRVQPEVIEGFSKRLFDWTRGNAFFLEAAIRGLVETGKIRKRHGRWLGWEVQKLELPQTIKDAVTMRFGLLSSDAQQLAELAAIMGGQVAFGTLAAVWSGPEDSLVPALAELGRRGVLLEGEADGEIHYRFSHPLIPDTLEGQLSLAAAQSLHGRVGRALETLFGDHSPDHVDELAYHFARARGDSHPEKAIQYLFLAGNRALERNAFSEASRYLEAALSRVRGLPETGSGTDSRDTGARGVVAQRDLMESLARAEANLGHQDQAIELWWEALERVEKEGDGAGAADLLRRIGQAHLSQGRLTSAMRAFEEGAKVARRAGDRLAEARLHLVETFFLQHAGRSAEAKKAVQEGLTLADELGDRRLQANVSRSLLLIHLWNGELDLVREKGPEIRSRAAEIADPHLMFWSEWTLAATDGLSGDTDGFQRRVQELQRLSERARSPRLGLWATELSLEYAYASGAWDLGIGIGEQAVSLGRALSERTILPRILVDLSLIYVGRGEVERAGELVAEAWNTSGAAGVAEGVEYFNVHTVVPAHIGRVAYLLALKEWEKAIEVAKAGLEVADRTGYVLWGIHRLLPLLGEACLHAGFVEEAEAVSRRLRRCGEDLDHDLARAWATAGEALVAWKKGDPAKGARLLHPAAALLDGIPLVFDAARLRRQLAGRLLDVGDREGARRELEGVRRVFEELGAGPELEKTKGQLVEVGA